jgi:hypothetical protein
VVVLCISIPYTSSEYIHLGIIDFEKFNHNQLCYPPFHQNQSSTTFARVFKVPPKARRKQGGRGGGGRMRRNIGEDKSARMFVYSKELRMWLK